ncbi:hypothetical protein BC827DRAFT_1373375 [Russula dissimulans]|nr:hypothetical protein BC827DRAFT_1373375 [Russula dissimulans]
MHLARWYDHDHDEHYKLPSMLPDDDEQFDIPNMMDSTVFDHLSLLNDTSPSSADSASSQADSPPDWSQFSNLWDNEHTLQPTNLKFEPATLDFALSIPFNMDLDFDPSLAVDPTALHFDPKMFSTADFAPFPPQQQSVLSQSLTPRRMSITSSSSGASLSPIMDPAASSIAASVPSPPAPSLNLSSTTLSPVTPTVNDPVDDLAQSVRQAAGVTLAVPVQGQAEHLTFSNAQKLPIPRLQRPSPATSTGSKRKSPTAELNPSLDPALGGTVAVIGRPKTSHTTIERRYRTNLNARIQSLKDAVPALRVLENKERAKKDQDTPETQSEAKSEKPSWNDVVDERGFVDGVKVARKISKANVLGKAAEYIHVLKRRENRLKREQAGLRSLISGLVGGPALLREWEREWVSRFGGPERDEATSDVSDDDGADDGESDDDDVNLHPKKRIKCVPKKPTKDAKPKKETSPGIVPEKRKRGRPRKVQPMAEGGPAQQKSQPQETATSPVPAQPTQYLLAVFAFLSFFNSPLASYSRPHPIHSGVVLADSGSIIPLAVSTSTFGWRELLQAFHLVVSSLVFFSILLPFLPKGFPRLRSLSSSPKFPRTDAARRAALINALDQAQRGTSNEAACLLAALGVYPGFLGLLLSFATPTRGRKTKTLEHKQLEQRAWVRLAELAVFDRMSCYSYSPYKAFLTSSLGTTSFGRRAQAYWGMVSHTPAFSTSPSDLSTLALLIFPIWRARAATLWTRAIHARVVRPFERAVISSMTVEEGYVDLAKASDVRLSPLGSLAVRHVRRAVANLAGRTFVRAVLGTDAQLGDSEVYEKDAHEEERRAVADAGRSMGGPSMELVGLLERICTGMFVRYEETQSSDDSDVEEDERGARMLLGAIVLYRGLFPSGLPGSMGIPVVLSPPPSPSRRNVGLRAALRLALDGEVFYSGGSELEEARDRVIDMLVDVDRASRRRV